MGRGRTQVDCHDAPNAPPSANLFMAALERPGTYNVIVRASGNREWVRPGVVVRGAGRCDDLHPATIAAKIEPSAR